MKRQTIGLLGEKLARDHLKKKGLSIIETNYRCREGEIDIIARQKDYLVFVEVRTKSNLEFGTPEESINFAKMNHLKRSARHYIMTHDKLPELWRIDIVAIVLGADNKPVRIDVIENAIED